MGQRWQAEQGADAPGQRRGHRDAQQAEADAGAQAPDLNAGQRHPQGDQHQRHGKARDQVDAVGEPQGEGGVGQQQDQRQQNGVDGGRAHQGAQRVAAVAGHHRPQGELEQRDGDHHRDAVSEAGAAEGVEHHRQAHIAGVGVHGRCQQHPPVLAQQTGQRPGHRRHGADHQRRGEHGAAEVAGLDLGAGERGDDQRRRPDIEDQAGNELDRIGLPQAHPGKTQTRPGQYRGHHREEFGKHAGASEEWRICHCPESPHGLPRQKGEK